MLNWDEVRHQSQSAYKTDARAVQQKKQAKADSPSSIDWNRVYYTPNILKFQESERQEAAKRQKLMEAKIAAEQAQSEQTQAQRQAEWDNRQQELASFIGTQQAKQSGAPLMSRIEAEIRSTPESVLKDPMMQFTSGAYEGTLAKTIDKMRQLSGYETPAALIAELSSQYADGWRTAGRLYGSTIQNLALYGTLGKAAEGMDALQGISNPFLRNLAGQQLADTLIQAPGVVIEGIADKKPVGEVLKDVGIQQGQDLAANLIVGGLEAGLKAIANKLKSGRALSNIEIETVKNTPELRQLPEAEQYLMLPEGRPEPEVIYGMPIKPTDDELDILRRGPSSVSKSNTYPALDELNATEMKMLINELTDNRQKLIDEQVDWLKRTSGQGVEQGTLLRDEYGDVIGRHGRISKNETWYQDWARENGYRKITESELREIAEQQLREGYESTYGMIPPDKDFNFVDGWLNHARERQNSPERYDDILRRQQMYEQAEYNLGHTVPEQYRRETPFTVFRASSNEPPKVDPKYAREEFIPIGGRIEPAQNNVRSDAVISPAARQAANIDTTPQDRVFRKHPRGEIPEGMKERGFSRNIRTDTAMPDDIRQMFDENPVVYKQISNNETLSKAEKIFSQGEEAATAEFYRSIGAKEFKPETVPLAKMLAKQANEAGNVAKAREILSATAERLTEAGQYSQAANILREADPETFLMTIDKQLRKLNEQGAKLYKKKWTNIDLLPDEITAIQSIPRGNQQAYEEVWEQIGNRIAKELPSTKMEKFDAWRRMAMLLNPTTHIRNTGGNIIMMGMRKVGDTIGAALEKAFGVKTGERTKSFGWSFNKNIASKVDETWEAVKKDILGESRWRIDNLKSLGREKRIFKKGLPTKAVEAITGHKFDRGALQWVNEFSLKTLNAEDNIFTKRAFKDALGQFMQANKLTEATDAAIEYARRRALEATFKQTNELASTLNRWKQIPVAGKFVEGAVPFAKTPANIVMRGIEYSPGGILKALYDVKAGKTAAQAIEDLSKGLTGTGTMILGYYLGSSGWAKVERHRSKKAEGLYQSLGDQAYAINTPYGSYTFDWAQPFSMPLAMGIAISEAIKSRKDGDTMLQAIWDGIAAGGDTIFNMTMLQNIREIIGSYGSPTEKIMGIPLDYLEQAVFSVFGQAARTIDPIRRSTYDPNAFRQWTKGIQARIPGLSQRLEPALDIWGQEQYHGGALQQFINPGYYKERSDDRVTNEVARLHGEFQDNDMLPKVAPRSFTHKGEKYELTAQQVTEFQRKMGQENYSDIARLISSAEYQRMTDEEKVKKIKKIVNDNYEEAKQDIIKASALKGN